VFTRLLAVLTIAAALFSQTQAQTPTDAMARGRQAYQMADFKKAVQLFEQAATADPRSSDVQHWLGRAYGRMAETSSFLTAPRYASKCRQAFERAVELDANNKEAWNDLFSYYMDAPGFLGGGLDKAEKAVARIAALDAAEGHFARAQLAQKRQDFEGAEQELQRAVDLAPRAVGRIVDLAVFLSKRGKRAPADQAFAKAAAIDATHPRYLFERAQVLVTEKRQPEEARRLLEEYLKAKLGPDDAPASDARKLLAQLPPAK
jgi:tetratricopeptide (TPR) repeat protein